MKFFQVELVVELCLDVLVDGFDNLLVEVLLEVLVDGLRGLLVEARLGNFLVEVLLEVLVDDIRLSKFVLFLSCFFCRLSSASWMLMGS